EIALSLIQVSVSRGVQELLRRTAIVREVRFASPRERDERGVMEVVVPCEIEAEAVLVHAARESRLLRFILACDDDGPAPGGVARHAADLAQQVRARVVVDVV